MTETDLETGLKALANTVEEIKALLAWEQLKCQERRPGDVPAFVPNEDIDGDLRNLYSLFLATSLEMRDMLGNDSVPEFSQTRQRRYRQQLLQMEGQVRSLNLPERFIKP